MNPQGGIQAQARVLAPPILGANHILRTRIQAELAVVRDLLARYGREEPIAQCISIWHDGILSQLRPPRGQPDPLHVPDPQQVLTSFVEELEELFRDPLVPPLAPNAPFNPELFGEAPSPLVQYVISRMINSSSLLYSQEMEQEYNQARGRGQVRRVVPIAQPPVAQRPHDFEEQLRLINVRQDEREHEEAQVAESIEQIERLIQIMAVESRQGIAAIDRFAQEQLQQLGGEVAGLRRMGREEKENLLNAAHRLQNEAEELRGEVRELRVHIARGDVAVEKLRTGCVQLQIAINETRAKIKDQKRRWIKDVLSVAAIVAVSFVATWAISSVAPGFSVSGTKQALNVGFSTIF